MLLALLASLSDQIALHGTESLTRPTDNDELTNLQHKSTNHYASHDHHTTTGNEAEEGVTVVVQQLVEEEQHSTDKTHVARGGVTIGELLRVSGCEQNTPRDRRRGNRG